METTGDPREVRNAGKRRAATAGRRLFSVLLPMLSASVVAACTGAPVRLSFSQAPALPDPVGFAGMGAGVAGDTVIAVGGAHFPDKKPWEGGAKVYNKAVYVFGSGAWRTAGELSGVMAYPAYAGTPRGLVVAGGTDDKTNFKATFRVAATATGLAFETLPDLPAPVAFAACAVLDNRLVVIGGTDSPSAVTASNAVFSLDLASPEKGWTVLPSLPGAGRMLSVAGVHGGKLYVFGGCSLTPKDGKPYRTYLREALVLDANAGAWKRVADLPDPLVASVGPAPASGDALLLIGGDTGFFYDNGRTPAEHPGQPTTVYAYRPSDDTYAVAGRLPVGIVTAPAVDRGDAVWLISGETGPGRRTNAVTVIERR